MSYNTKKEMWLPVSLYCAKCEWGEMITKVIKPYLQNLFQDKRLLHFRFQIDNEGGENIRLAMLVKSDTAECIAKESDDYFKACFVNKQSQNVVRFQPARELFMRFPPNIICYGLYQIDEASSGISNYDDFQTEFSKLLIEGLGAGEMNDFKILLIAFRFYLSLLITIWKVVDVKFEDLMCIQFHFTKIKNVMIDVGSVKNRFDENKWGMYNISYNIMKQSENQPFFMLRWVELCKNKIIAVKDAGPEAARSVFNEISLIIDRQLDISESVKYEIYSLVKKVTTI